MLYNHTNRFSVVVLTFSLFFVSVAYGEVISAQAAGSKGQQTPVTDSYKYNESTGKCLNKLGKEGFNTMNPRILFAHPVGKTKASGGTYTGVDAECVDFSNVDLGHWIGIAYAGLVTWSFKGANFQGTGFYFAGIAGSDLRGANLSGIQYGYAHIEGTTDNFTTIPTTGTCSNVDNQLSCRQ